MKKGLVLAGGGAKGSYQVGVYEALRSDLGWKPDIVTGTSVGCLNGALFALDLLEPARELWLELTSADVMTLPDDTSPASLHRFFRDLVQGGGLDVTPLQERIDRLIDEPALRAAPVRYGLVTVEMSNLHPHELTLEEIPEGQLRDYMLASSACFPAFRPRVIDGVRYIDGGYNDNIPYALAARMGADELVAVNVYGLGVNRPNTTGLPTVQVESRWDLGNILGFDPEVARRNIALGRLDCLRAFGRLRGAWYGVEREDDWPRLFAVCFDSQLGRLADVPGGAAAALAVRAALELQRSPDRELKPLELAARALEVDPTRSYTPRALALAVQQAAHGGDYEAYEAWFEGHDEDDDGEALTRLRQALNPSQFICALCLRTLRELL